MNRELIIHGKTFKEGIDFIIEQEKRVYLKHYNLITEEGIVFLRPWITVDFEPAEKEWFLYNYKDTCKILKQMYIDYIYIQFKGNFLEYISSYWFERTAEKLYIEGLIETERGEINGRDLVYKLAVSMKDLLYILGVGE